MMEGETMIRIGQTITFTGFTNTFGETVPRCEGMTVTRVRLITPSHPGPHSINPYYRIQAVKGFALREGAARFFE